MHVELQAALYKALDDIIYKGQTVSRWAVSAQVARVAGDRRYSTDYIKLLLDDLDELAAAHQALRDVLHAAYMQDVSRETTQEAA